MQVDFTTILFYKIKNKIQPHQVGDEMDVTERPESTKIDIISSVKIYYLKNPDVQEESFFSLRHERSENDN